ncbi:MAG: hypothetical protein KAG53_09390 [Endozoicomonadaceae bacterium]|nr:hypothetical protein [Endozoicomonadaceae bacterium]
MIPNTNVNNVPFQCQAAGGFTDEMSIDMQIMNADYEVVKYLLNTKMLTENQLHKIKSRFADSLTTQDTNFINQMIDFVREGGLEQQETVVSPFNAVGVEIRGRTVSPAPAHNVQAIANQPQVSHQAPPSANQGNSGAANTLATTPKTKKSCIKQEALDLIARHCNNTDIDISEAIDRGNLEVILHLLSYQPMTPSQLCNIESKADLIDLSNKKIKEVKRRIDNCHGDREISTPYWNRVYRNESNESFADIISQYNALIPILMTIIVTPENHSRFIALHPEGPNEETIQDLLDVSKEVVISPTDHEDDGYERVNVVMNLSLNTCNKLVSRNSTETDTSRTLQEILSDSTAAYDREIASRHNVPPTWNHGNQAQPQAPIGNEKSPEELIAENEELKEKRKCQYASCINMASILYLHGAGNLAHIVHCKEHSLSVNDLCPNCEQIIEVVVQGRHT